MLLYMFLIQTHFRCSFYVQNLLTAVSWHHSFSTSFFIRLHQLQFLMFILHNSSYIFHIPSLLEILWFECTNLFNIHPFTRPFNIFIYLSIALFLHAFSTVCLVFLFYKSYFPVPSDTIHPF